jgi:acyl transferase domain-containing protein
MPSSYGGTNAHVIMDQAQEYLHDRHLEGQVRSSLVQHVPHVPTQNGVTNGKHTTLPKRRIFTLSVFDKSSGRQQAQALRDYLSQPGLSERHKLMDELEYTLNYRRSIFG